MGSNTETLCQCNLAIGVGVGVSKIKASVGRERERCYLLHIGKDGFDTADSLLGGHGWPSLVQLKAHRMLHDDILAANGIRGIVTPVKDGWNRHSSVRLDWQQDKG